MIGAPNSGPSISVALLERDASERTAADARYKLDHAEARIQELEHYARDLESDIRWREYSCHLSR